MKFTHEKGFTALWTGELISKTGSLLSSFALSYYIFSVTQNPFYLTIAQFCRFFPSIILSFYTGIIIDKFPRKKILIFSNSLLSLISLSIYCLLSLTPQKIFLLFPLLVLVGIIDSFQNISFQSVVPLFVGREKYVKYNGRLSILEILPGLVTPFISALLLNWIGIEKIYIIDSFSFLLALISVFLVSFPKIHTNNSFSKKITLDDISYGTKIIWKNSLLSKLLILFMIINLLQGLTAGLISAFILSSTNNNKYLLALTLSALTAGGLCGSIFVSFHTLKGGKTFNMLVSLILSGFVGRIIVG